MWHRGNAWSKYIKVLFPSCWHCGTRASKKYKGGRSITLPSFFRPNRGISEGDLTENSETAWKILTLTFKFYFYDQFDKKYSLANYFFRQSLNSHSPSVPRAEFYRVALGFRYPEESESELHQCDSSRSVTLVFWAQQRQSGIKITDNQGSQRFFCCGTGRFVTHTSIMKTWASDHREVCEESWPKIYVRKDSRIALMINGAR